MLERPGVGVSWPQRSELRAPESKPLRFIGLRFFFFGFWGFRNLSSQSLRNGSSPTQSRSRQATSLVRLLSLLQGGAFGKHVMDLESRG